MDGKFKYIKVAALSRGQRTSICLRQQKIFQCGLLHRNPYVKLRLERGRVAGVGVGGVMRQKQELAACRGRTKLEEAGACSYLPSEINTTHINMSSEKKGWGAGIVGVQKVTKHLMNFFTFTYHPLSFTKNIDIVSVSLMTSTYSR